jgi:hypothetical protein
MLETIIIAHRLFRVVNSYISNLAPPENGGLA